MLKFKQSLIAIAGLALLIGLIFLATPGRSQGNSDNAPPPFNVIVTNTPLPVTGTVSVGNLGDSPLPVRDVDNPARQPFSHTFVINAQLGSALGTLSGGRGPFTVPAGKRLVIEDASAQLLLPVGQRPQVVLEVQDPAPSGAFRINRPLTLTFQLTSILGIPASDTYVGGEPVRMYLEPGERLRAFFQRSGTSDSGVAEVYVQGYFVDVP